MVLTVEPVVLHSHVLAFEITRFFTEPFKKRGGLALGRTGRHTADKADYRHGRLLRARRERPRHRRAAEQRDELAALHSITSSARASRLSGISRPSAFAVLRLITNSNFAGSITGRSPGFSPLRMRPA